MKPKGSSEIMNNTMLELLSVSLRFNRRLAERYCAKIKKMFEKVAGGQTSA
jgi:hypothetical protein